MYPVNMFRRWYSSMHCKLFNRKRRQGHAVGRRSLVGFTMVEALIALSIIVIAFLNILYLVSFSVGHLREARDFMVGSYLAQEGIELVTVYRNENWLNQRAFDSGLSDGTYRADYSGVWDTSATLPIKFDDQYGYQYVQGTDTSFVREITITKMSANFLRVDSTVHWDERGQARSVTVEDNLYDWFSVPTQ